MYEIIYVDDTLADRRLAALAHRDSGIGVPLRGFASGASFLAYLDGIPADDTATRVLLLDLNLPGDDGLAILRRLQLRPAGARMLVWMFSNSRWQQDDQAPLRQAGAVRFLSKPTDYDLGVELFREIGRLLEPQTTRDVPTPGAVSRVLLIEDSPMDAILVSANLLALAPGLELVHVTTLAAAHQQLGQSSFDGLVLDLHLPDAQEMLGLKSLMAAWPQLPIVAVSGRYDDGLGRDVIRQGAQDFFSKTGLEARSLMLVLEFAVERQNILNRLRGELRQTRADALTDTLTGLPNRRALLDAYHQLPVQMDPVVDATSALVVIDIDGLKSVNDLHGHRQGDELIQLVAATLKGRLRTGDVLSRVGGDEFVLLLRDLPQGDWAEVMVERLRSAIDALPPLAGGLVQASASFGHAMIPRRGEAFDTLFAIADTRMYDDKAARRQPVRTAKANAQHRMP